MRAAQPVATPPPGDESSAQPEPSEADQARELAEEGRRLYWRGEYVAAIEAFSRAHELAADPNLLYNISAAYEKLGQLDRALAYLDRYAAEAPAEERDAIAARRRELEQQKAAAEQPPEPTPPQPAEPAKTQPAPPPDRPTPQPKIMGAAGWSLVAVAGAGLAVGTGFGIASLVVSRRGRDQCFDDAGSLRCPTSARSDLAAAKRNAIVADVALGVGLAATVAVVTVVGVRLRARKRARVSLHGVGVRGSF